MGNLEDINFLINEAKKKLDELEERQDLEKKFAHVSNAASKAILDFEKAKVAKANPTAKTVRELVDAANADPTNLEKRKASRRALYAKWAERAQADKTMSKEAEEKDSVDREADLRRTAQLLKQANEAFARGDKTLSAQLHKEAWSK